MKILILGGDGMLGHQLFHSYKRNHEIKVTLRKKESFYLPLQIFNAKNSYFDIDLLQDFELWKVILDFQPEVVINAAGITKKRLQVNDPIACLGVNAIFPHKLALMCKAVKTRLIHISSDCVFSGIKGNYKESDLSDAKDLYGKSKYLGELHEEHCVTLRTSIIGLEIMRYAGLVEWFLSQENAVQGYTKAIYTGLTTNEMARVIEQIIMDHPHLSGVWHVASEPINKFQLLSMLAKKINKNIQINRSDKVKCNRSLIGDAFVKETNYVIPGWNTMLNELSDQIIERNARMTG